MKSIFFFFFIFSIFFFSNQSHAQFKSINLSCKGKYKNTSGLYMEIYETLSCSNTVSKFCKTTILNLGINLNGGDPGTLNYDFWGIANVGSGGQFRIENSAITIGNKIISNKPLIQKILACSKLGSGCNAHAMQGWLKTSTTWGNFINNLNSRRAVSINISLGLESLPQQFTPDTEIELECKLKHS